MPTSLALSLAHLPSLLHTFPLSSRAPGIHTYRNMRVCVEMCIHNMCMCMSCPIHSHSLSHVLLPLSHALLPLSSSLSSPSLVLSRPGGACKYTCHYVAAVFHVYCIPCVRHVRHVFHVYMSTHVDSCRLNVCLSTFNTPCLHPPRAKLQESL